MIERSSGILLHISSLPSPYGIGTFGRAAYAFIDFLEKAGQKYWQVLPLGPTSYGDSPYQSFSAVAGNPYFIDLDMLIDEGLLDRADVEGRDWGGEPAHVDYGCIFNDRLDVLSRAYSAFSKSGDSMAALEAFARENAAWLDDYALYMALKDENGGRPFTEWPEGVRLRENEALKKAGERLHERVELYTFIQYMFFRQFHAMKDYANAHGIAIIGDLPIYVPLDSADVWASPEEFQLDAERRPRNVAGVPPDSFSADGQLWGNPLYEWAHMEKNGFAWWMRRMAGAAKLYDVIRIDHFRGLSSYWSVPVGETTAKNGCWVQGPGMRFIDAIKARFPNLDIIAEDLGYLTDDVRALLRGSGFPGTKVLQFAFDSREPSNYLPHTYPHNCVCYTGTHDNNTVAGWLGEASFQDVDAAVRYLGLNTPEGFNSGFIRGGMSSVANLFIAQMQDYLDLGADARMNTPGTLGGNNWRWRLMPGKVNDALAARIAEMTSMYGR